MVRLELRDENGDSMHLKVREEVMEEFIKRRQPEMTMLEELKLVNEILDSLNPSIETEAQ